MLQMFEDAHPNTSNNDMYQIRNGSLPMEILDAVDELDVEGAILGITPDVILPEQHIPHIEHRSRSRDGSLGRPVDEHNYRIFKHLLGLMVNIMNRYNITYILSDGTLLGSYLYHDMLPWDDDIDIRVAYKDYPKLKQFVYKNPSIKKYLAFHGWGDVDSNEFNDDNLNTIYSDIETHKVNGRSTTIKRLHRHKWFFRDQPKTFQYPWRWPFIDIFFMKENSTHLWTLENDRFTFYYNLSDIYPLHLRPFAGMWIYSPRNTRHYLKEKYKSFNCQSHSWNHVAETSKVAYKKSCHNFDDVYPFVIRTKHGNGTLERLVLNGNILYTTYVRESFTGKGHVYSLD